MVKPRKMVLEKATVEELQDILDGKINHGEVVSCGCHGLLCAIPMTDFRTSVGGFLDNVAAGRKLAVTRKGKVIAILLPPDNSKPLTIEELEAELAKGG